MSLGSELVRVRREKGLPRRKAAADIGVAEATLRDWEDGRRPTDQFWVRIAKFLERPVGEVEELAGPPTPRSAPPA